jgi:hypothetical protein
MAIITAPRAILRLDVGSGGLAAIGIVVDPNEAALRLVDSGRVVVR